MPRYFSCDYYDRKLDNISNKWNSLKSFETKYSRMKQVTFLNGCFHESYLVHSWIHYLIYYMPMYILKFQLRMPLIAFKKSFQWTNSTHEKKRAHKQIFSHKTVHIQSFVIYYYISVELYMKINKIYREEFLYKISK